jgi:glycogen operon protein
MGPTLSFRGIDNTVYYRLLPNDPRYYLDYTGTGNTLNVRHPRVLQLIMDSLRYWVLEMHVDGFRFDLAATLARELHEVDRLGAFLDIIHQDPILSQVKLIAEPWDLGEGGYQVGKFPVGWAEWNDRYRDAVRSYWKGDGGLIGELAYRITGSSDLYERSGRSPYASINFVTAHDGFTLNDLVSYNSKHNEANGEENRDGTDNNRSWNCGVEGPTDDPAVLALRERQKRNLLATLFLSQGVPMLLGGDAMGHTQNGNNNAYCQDNEISWIDWDEKNRNSDLLEFTRLVIELRRNHPVFRRRKFFQGRAIKGADIKDIVWLLPGGEEMSDEGWGRGSAQCLGVFLAGDGLDEVDEHAEPVRDESFLVLLNAHHEPVPFQLPTMQQEGSWLPLIDTARERGIGSKEGQPGGAIYPLEARSMAVLVARGAGQVRLAERRREA